MSTVNSVLGPIDTSEMGFTLSHEHVLITSAGIQTTFPEFVPRDETISVIVVATAAPEDAFHLYRRVMARIDEIYGEADQCRPITVNGLRTTLSSAVLRHESRVRTWRTSPLRRLAYSVRLRLEVIVGWFLLTLGVRTDDVEWDGYRRDVVANTDFRKFDGSLRLVIAGDQDQRRELENYLDDLHRDGEVVFGIHVARSALMTCLIERRQSAHFHFVDGASGGYAAAAKALKQSLGDAGTRDDAV